MGGGRLTRPFTGEIGRELEDGGSLARAQSLSLDSLRAAFPSPVGMDGYLSSHSFDIHFLRPSWPPFYATALFLPRVKVRIRNDGELIEAPSFSAYLAPYDGPIGDIPGLKEGWRDVFHLAWEKKWKAGKRRSILVKVPPEHLPKAGTYVMRFHICSRRPADSPLEELKRQMDGADMTENQRTQALESATRAWKRLEIDPNRPQQGATQSDEIASGFLFEFFRVEELSNVLNLWGIGISFLTALGTLVLALLAFCGPDNGSH
jgi:hypothetical protein